MHRRVWEYFTSRVLSSRARKIFQSRPTHNARRSVRREATSRKEIFEINHGSRQQVYGSAHDSGTGNARCLAARSVRIRLRVCALCTSRESLNTNAHRRKEYMRMYATCLLIRKNETRSLSRLFRNDFNVYFMLSVIIERIFPQFFLFLSHTNVLLKIFQLRSYKRYMINIITG